MPRGMVLSLAPKVKMYLFTTVSLLVMAIDHCLKDRKLSSSPRKGIKAGRHQRCLQLKLQGLQVLCIVRGLFNQRLFRQSLFTLLPLRQICVRQLRVEGSGLINRPFYPFSGCSCTSNSWVKNLSTSKPFLPSRCCVRTNSLRCRVTTHSFASSAAIHVCFTIRRAITSLANLCQGNAGTRYSVISPRSCLLVWPRLR